MNDAGPLHPADARKLPSAVMQKSRGQGSLALAGAGVNHHAGRLVDDEKMRVFVPNIERNLFGLDVGGHGRWQLHHDARAAWDSVRRFRLHSPVD